MDVPFLNLQAGYLELKTAIDEGILNVLEGGQYIGGSAVDSFEDQWARYCGVKHAVSVGSGLDALAISLESLGVGPGDEVIVPSHTFIATWLAVSAIGATVIPVKVDIETCNIEPCALHAALSSKTKCIIPVHLYGCPADLGPIVRFAEDHGLYVIEDAAQSHGARYQGERIGGHSDLVSWSFYPGKNLGAFGDGGCITTNSSELADKIRLIRNYGSAEKYIHQLRGKNSRLDPIQAVCLSTKLDQLDSWNSRRQQIAQYYLDNITNKDVTLPAVPDNIDHAWHLFVVRSSKRDCLQAYLLENGVQTLIHYPTPPHQQACYLGQYGHLQLPDSQLLSATVLSLPMGPHLTLREAEYVVDVINRFQV